MASRATPQSRLQGVASVECVTLTVTFDRLLDPSHSFPGANFQLIAIDSVGIPITGIRTPREERDRQLALQRQATDSARRADSIARRPLVPVPRVTPDTAGQPNRPGPFTTLSVVIAHPLKPSTNYLLRVTTVRALSGRSTGSERRFTTPKPPPPPRPDTMRVPTPTPNGAPPPTTPPRRP